MWKRVKYYLLMVFLLFIYVYWIGMFACNMVGMSKNTSKIKIKKLN